jgi:hypothetical protein
MSPSRLGDKAQLLRDGARPPSPTVWRLRVSGCQGSELAGTGPQPDIEGSRAGGAQACRVVHREHRVLVSGCPKICQ